MLVFCENKILLRDKKYYDFDYDEIKSNDNFNILSTSEDLPSVWKNSVSWADVEIINFNPSTVSRFPSPQAERQRGYDKTVELISVRDLYFFAGDEAFSRASRAFQFRNWFKDIKFCSHCGGKLFPSSNDFGRICEVCGKTFYAPISPAIITAIEKNGKLLLAHNTAWIENRFSIIAGFVEPGERLEETVKREIREEVGIEVKNIKYFGSQTWPFPNSLMLGFTAEYLSGEVKPDGVEISNADFYSPDEIKNMNIPDGASIARKLIENFLTKSEKRP
ncbi:MAG: NAD(+) diphosphatase [Synergistaceae bacterium]|nr:NAD(+) diphosphatase [Synergistaceae bacterium]